MNNENVYSPVSAQSSESIGEAFDYLKSLPRNIERPALDSYRRGRTSQIIDHEVAESFTDSFRGINEPFFIPVSWTLTKEALLNLLGVTDYEGHAAVNGIRFYAGLNPDKQLTLIAVSTSAGTGCNEDLTVQEQYPYYDFADPCPNNCSNRGNLRTQNAVSLKVAITQ